MVTVTSSLFKDTDVDCVKIEIQSNSFLSLVPKTVKNTPAMQETQVLSLSQEDPLEKEKATHSSIFAWEIPWTEEPGWLLHGVSESWTQLSY